MKLGWNEEYFNQIIGRNDYGIDQPLYGLFLNTSIDESNLILVCKKASVFPVFGFINFGFNELKISKEFLKSE
ncbi:hypothetical protein [Lysinibacillus fusiformis]|uniref:hypothetical protein n=1 Tax=Lysinibacillus fusiformis TaxID=28031 RepID=UPI00263AA149|nr:hypothetical protein [Lysinibacillus fusiformis]MDC6270619.1 hypothetical protein [Lysinibacillus sphaericus]MDN4969067.1 hypothetical protein [Lysinibacillus fusiformis]